MMDVPVDYDCEWGYLHYKWKVMEQLQDNEPWLELGWWSFVVMPVISEALMEGRC